MIRVLDKSVSNKIAAGEVVERPLSIVKELVENSIDAGASAVSVDLADGGIKKITITDNGSGINTADVKLAFEKHATSKISTLQDLGHIITQGFRGEALSSIAAVSIVDMKTKTSDEDIGTHIRISGGRLDFCRPEGLPEGTSITVSNLFFNVPARLNFLRSKGKEAALVSDLVSRYILSFPEISFHYRSQGKTIYHSPGSGDLKDAIYCVYGRDVMDNIAYVDESFGGYRAYGYVARPGTTMKNKNTGSIFVNRRYVRNRALFDMVRSAYGQTLVKGEYPFFALNIDLPASKVDVNVHPNKLQVRFRDNAAVEHVIKEAVSSACTQIRGKIEIPVPQSTPAVVEKVQMQVTRDFEQPDFFSGFSRSVLKEETSVQDDLNDDEQHTYVVTDEEVKQEPVITYSEEPEPQPKIEQEIPTGEPINIQNYRLIGSFTNTYVLVEQGDNLLMIDQHAAHERLLYEKFISSKETASQQLMIPKVITVSHAQKNIIDENSEVLSELGFDISLFGSLEYKISAVPSLLKDCDAHELLLEVLGDIRNPIVRKNDLIRMSCRRAIKANDKLNDQELNSLVNSFLSTDVMPTCPHGRPIITVLTKKQIEKSFKRTI